MSEMTYFTVLYFTVFLDHLFKNTGILKHRKYQQIQTLHFPWQQAETSKNTNIYSVSGQCFFNKMCFFPTAIALGSSAIVKVSGQNRQKVPPRFRAVPPKFSKFRFCDAEQFLRSSSFWYVLELHWCFVSSLEVLIGGIMTSKMSTLRKEEQGVHIR